MNEKHPLDRVSKGNFMIGYAPFMGQIRLASQRRLGQEDYGIPYYPEFLDRWQVALLRMFNVQMLVMSIPEKIRPPMDILEPDWAKDTSSKVSDEWTYKVGEDLYVFGDPVQKLKKYEDLTENSERLVEDALGKTIQSGRQIADLQKQMDQILNSVQEVSKEEKDTLKQKLENCRQLDMTPDGVECLRALLSEIQALSKRPSVWVWVIGALAVVGVIKYVSSR